MSTRLKHTTVTILFFLTIFSWTACKKSADITPVPEPPAPVVSAPVLGVSTYTVVSASSVAINCAVTDSGNAIVTERGVCFGTQPGPTIAGQKIIAGAGNGTFTAVVTGLAPDKEFHFRAYATNSRGTSYGNALVYRTKAIDSARLVLMGGAKNLYCFNAADGALKWAKNLPAEVTSSPAYANGMVYIGCNNNYLYAYDTTGVLKWSAFTASTETMDYSSPIVYKDIVMIRSCSQLFAFDANTGTLRWKFGAIYEYVLGAATLDKDILYINYKGTGAIDPNTGTLLWSNYTQNRFTKPAVYNGKMFGLFDYDFRILNKADGNVLYTKYTSISNVITLSGGFGNAYMLKDDGIKAFDTLTGAQNWAHGTGGGYAYRFNAGASPVISDSLVHAVANGRVVAYNAVTGAVVTEYGGNILDADVTVVNGVSYFGTRDVYNTYSGFMYAISVANDGTKSQLWRSAVKSDYHTTPCVVTMSGKMYRAGDTFN